MLVPSREPPAAERSPPGTAAQPRVLSPQECCAAPLFERKENKEAALLDLDGRAHTLAKRHAALRDAGARIQQMVEVRGVPGRCPRNGADKERVPRSRAAALRTRGAPPSVTGSVALELGV